MLNRESICVCFAGLLTCASVCAQANSGNLQGTVSDASGAVIAGATVAAKRLPQGASQIATTDGVGKYRIEGLAGGDYEIRYSMTGFKETVLKEHLAAGQTLTRDVVLQVGSLAETVEVRASPMQMQTSTSQLGTTRANPAPRSRRNREDYGHTPETGFATVLSKPLSTFSIDVDTAAYTNLRRFLLQHGQLPPKDAVRIEELLNYFDYEYAAPEGRHPFSVTTEISECPWNREHQLVHIGLKSKPISAKDLPPANLTFLIDVSGSMMGDNKLPLIKRSLRLLVEQLREQDRVSMVVYAGAAGVVLPPTKGSQKERILDALDGLQAGGSTAGAEGIRLAYATARKSFSKHANNRVILATDGDFNVGVSSDSELVKLIESERDGGIFLTVLGYGYGNLKDAKLEGLARNGNGNYAYVDNILEARRVLVEQLGATLLTVAKDVKLQVEFNPSKIRAYRLIGYENRRLTDEEFKDDKKDAGELGAGHSVTAIYEVLPASSQQRAADLDALKYQNPSTTGSQEALTVKLRYKSPKGSTSIQFDQTVDYRVQKPSSNFQLAMAVCELGLLLSGSQHKGSASFESVIANAQAAVGSDAGGRRSEFVYLARTAAKLAAVR